MHSYKPKPLESFILRDPKTRKISSSDFRDRVVHHALCNIIEPKLQNKFIHDSFSNQKGKGTLAAIKRFEFFKIKVSQNFSTLKNNKNIKGFVLKADINKFFDSLSQNILLDILQMTIKDKRIIWLIKIILKNHNTKEKGKGMPLGNLTSQFFANVYLNELDYYVKHNLKAKYYIRYVDDFVILNKSKEMLQEHQEKINYFLKTKLNLELHPDKSRIFSLYQGTDFLGIKIFSYYKSIKKRNINKFQKKIKSLYLEYKDGLIPYDKVYNTFEGWCAYIKNSDSYNLRKEFTIIYANNFSNEFSTKEINRLIKISKINPELHKSL